MANWATLKAAIANVIKTNGNQEITGVVLQNTLNSIISTVGENATFAGIATPSTNPGAPDGNVFYFATQAGTYSNFSEITIDNPGFYVISWSSSTWSKSDVMSIAQGLGGSDIFLVSQQAITNEIRDILNVIKNNNFINEVSAKSTSTGWINKDTGEITEEEGWHNSDYAISGGTLCFITGNSGVGGQSTAVAFYNASNEFIGSFFEGKSKNYSDYPIITPSGTAKVKVGRYGDNTPVLKVLNNEYKLSLSKIYKLNDNKQSLKGLFIQRYFMYIASSTNFNANSINYNGSWACLILKVYSGQVYTLKNIIGGRNGRAYAIFNNNFEALEIAGENLTIDTKTITISQDGYMVVNTNTTNNYDYDVQIEGFCINDSFTATYILGLWTTANLLKTKTEALETNVNNYNYNDSIEKSYQPSITNGWISISKGYIPDGNANDDTYKHTDFIPINDKTKIDIHLLGSRTGNIAVISYYSKPSPEYVLSDYTNNDSRVIDTVLTGRPTEEANYVRFSGNKQNFFVSVNPRPSALLIGASFAYSNNGWFEYAAEMENFDYVNRAVAGSRAYNAAINYSSWITPYISTMDVLVIMYSHNIDCYKADDLKDDYTEYTVNSSMSNAAAFDYIIKRYMADCAAIYKKPYIVLCTHWHDGRTIFNESVRKLAEKWSIPLVEFDKYTFGATQYHPTLKDKNDNRLTPSIINALTPPDNLYEVPTSSSGYIETNMLNGTLTKYDAELINSKICAWHPDRRYKTIDGTRTDVGLPDIQKIMGNVFIDIYKQYYK